MQRITELDLAAEPLGQVATPRQADRREIRVAVAVHRAAHIDPWTADSRQGRDGPAQQRHFEVEAAFAIARAQMEDVVLHDGDADLPTVILGIGDAGKGRKRQADGRR
jgi:hypothetical protein